MGFYYHDLHLDGPKSLDEFLFPAMRFPQRRIPAAFLYTRGIIVFRKERLFFYFTWYCYSFEIIPHHESLTILLSGAPAKRWEATCFDQISGFSGAMAGCGLGIDTMVRRSNDFTNR